MKGKFMMLRSADLNPEDEESKENLFECVKPSDVFNNCKPGV